MTKRLVIGDPHFKVSNLDDCYTFMQKVYNLVELEKPDEIVILGDMHDTHEKIHAMVLKAISEFFIKITHSYGVKIKYIVGNHDMINNKVFCEDLHVFNPFKYMKSVKIIDIPYWENDVLYVPYTEPGRFHEAISAIGDLPYSMVFCHQEFNGVQLGPKKSTSEDHWPYENPKIYSGHIHNHHHLQPNLCYVGVPFDHEFSSEGNIPRYLLLLDGTNEKWIPVDMPRRRSIYVTGPEFLNLSVDDTKDHLRIFVSITSEALHALKKTKKYNELSKIAKVIPQITDSVSVRAATDIGKKTYYQLLSESLLSESETVKKLFEDLYATIKTGKLQTT